MGILADAEPKN